MIACCAALLAAVAPPADGLGAVLVPELRGANDLTTDTRVWVYAGEPPAMVEGPLASGAHPVGKAIRVAEGTAWVEVGTQHDESGANRVRLQVKAGAVSVVPVGLISVGVEPRAEQPPDACAAWSGSFDVALQPLSGPAGVLVTRVETDGPTGLALVAAGYYQVRWNGGGIEVAVPAWTHYHLETGRVAPLRETDVQVAEIEGGRPTVRLCTRRATRLLARPWAATYSEPSSEPPFRKRVWAPLVVMADERKGGPFVALKRRPAKGELSAKDAAATPLWSEP